MSDYSNDISTSGPVEQQSFHVSDSFTNRTELPSKGYCRIVKAQRYGVWNVLKGLKPEYASEKQYQEMISKEFSLMVGLNHPNIVRTYGQEQVPELGTCIVMEFIDGRTLSDFIAENPPAIQRRQVIFELLDAIAYFHKKQIVHQDLKPSNILITHDGNHVKIIDFGLSDSRAYAILKSPSYTKAYASPEQLAGGEIDNRTDIYAFGLILQKLFPHNYTQIIKKCLQPQREKRYASSEILQEAIKQFDKKKKAIPALISILLVLAGLISAFFIFSDNKNKEQIEEMPEDSVAELNGQENGENVPFSTKKDTMSVEIEQSSNRFKSQNDIYNEDEAEELLQRYIFNLNPEFDSIIEPFAIAINSGKIKYREIFQNQKQITLLKMSIHIQSRKKQLPQSKRASFQDYAGDMWNRYSARYPYTDKTGKDRYPNFSDLYKDGKLSDEEYERLCQEDEEGVKETEKFLKLLEIEMAKD